MNEQHKKIPFKFDISRMLELFANQIYQSPLSLLRENTQNAFDAIRMRENKPDQVFEPIIEVNVDNNSVKVSDNGIGMTTEEVENNFWYAGKSGKNTDEARAAGVVGTFGIGAMANFGIADQLCLETESFKFNQRTKSKLKRSDISTEKDSISLEQVEPLNKVGTTVIAKLEPDCNINIKEAKEFLKQFVEFVDIPVYFNEEKLSGNSFRSVLPSERYSWSKKLPSKSIAGIISGDLEVFGMASGELRIVIENISSQSGLGRPGVIVLLQGRNTIRTMRTGFGLSTIGVSSLYRWGGIIDLPFLKPTAGREALDAASNQILQKIISKLDQIISLIAAEHTESFENNCFLQWIISTSKFNLCGPLKIKPRPSNEVVSLEEVVQHSGVKYYDGNDEKIIKTYASDDEPLITISRRSPRRNCEIGYLKLKKIQKVDTRPRVTEEFPLSELSFNHTALAMRITRILEDDYFLRSNVKFGSISGGVSILVVPNTNPVEIYLNPNSSTVIPLLQIYESDFDTFGPFVKDFIRSTLFSRISNLVPSSTREGSEAFLRHLRSNREWFEYEISDKLDLEEIFTDFKIGRLTIKEAIRKIDDKNQSYVEVSQAKTDSLTTIIKEFPNENVTNKITNNFNPIPAIDRREEITEALILTGTNSINGHKCFLAITDRIQREKGEFFLQPHSTEIVWGGRKVLFIFQHHAKQFGLYYDILLPNLIQMNSGGGQRITTTILTKNRTFIPIPEELEADFLPSENNRKRLWVKCDVLYLKD
ncbi:MAG: ATP-binding protein [Rhodobacteraceae bacterium]|nr:ATP-binding protein [Paracoccaceae bacterium]